MRRRGSLAIWICVLLGLGLPMSASATVETKWMMGNKHLKSGGELTLTGTFSFSGSNGSVSCPVSMKFLLTAETIKEEAPEGEVGSVLVANPSECDVEGFYGALCGTNSISSVEKTGAWSLFVSPSVITVKGLSLDYKFKGCAIPSVRLGGELTVPVSEPEAITSATFTGSKLATYNTSNEKTGDAEAGGSASASPPGTYQVTGAEGQFWFTDPGELMIGESEEPTEFTGEGELTFIWNGLGFVVGPYTADLRGFIWNDPEHGEGTINELALTGSASTNLPGCSQTATISPEAGLTLTLGRMVEISSITTIFHSSGGCLVYGIPSTYAVEGTLKGFFHNESGCILFEQTGDLMIEGSSTGLLTTGEICIHEEEGSFSAGNP